MESSPAVDYQTSQVHQFMAGITKDLDDHVITKSQKYTFDFEKEEPMQDVDADYQWFEVSNFSKSEVGGKKPRLNVFNDRKSTMDTEKISARHHLNTSMFSHDASNNNTMSISRQSSIFAAPTYFEYQVNPQRFAVLNKPTLTDNSNCILEEREDTPSPSQNNTDCEFGRESLAERPEFEGSIQNPFLLTVSVPFKAESSHQRQIPPISNCRYRAENGLVTRLNPLTASDQAPLRRPEAELVSGMQDLRVVAQQEQNRVATVGAESEREEDLVDLEGDGPSDSLGLHVYSASQHYTNIGSLDQCQGVGREGPSGQKQ